MVGPFHSEFDALEGLAFGTPVYFYKRPAEIDPAHIFVLDKVTATPAPFHLGICDLLYAHNYLTASSITA